MSTVELSLRVQLQKGSDFFLDYSIGSWKDALGRPRGREPGTEQVELPIWRGKRGLSLFSAFPDLVAAIFPVADIW